uniref:Uncharacterized protein n=2 Tax=Desertifilaceae TaxID=1969992 RepID=A0A1E5QPQ1_9CYAN|nr:hypothetical protein BH720_03510 [Desertifilum tharense IPPAS B-1220]
MEPMLKPLKRILCAFLIALMVTVSLGWTSPQPALAAVSLDLSIPPQLSKLLSNKQLVADAKNFLNATPETVCRAYLDQLRGTDTLKWQILQKGVAATWTITQAIPSASAAGAGALSGYAGIASAVSQLGLGGITTAIAGMMGSSVTGAAATAVVTSAVGGPLVMGTILVGGTGAAAVGTYHLSKFTADKLGTWADSNCAKYAVVAAE